MTYQKPTEALPMKNIITSKKHPIIDRLQDLLPFMDPASGRYNDFIMLNRMGHDHSTEAAFIDIEKNVDADIYELAKVVKRATRNVYVSPNSIKALLLDGDEVLLYVVGVKMDDGLVSINVIGDPKRVRRLAKRLEAFKVHVDGIEIITLDRFMPDTRPVTNVDVIVKDDIRLAHDTFYPFIPEGIEQLAKDFLESSSNVMIFVGLPGTGKSTLIRTLMSMMNCKKNAVVSSELAAISEGFVSWARSLGNNTLIAVEDAHRLIEKRENGNLLMSGFLNFAEGVVQSNTKIIISTNLPATRSIDQALLRPGRTFRVIEFRELNGEEGIRVRESMGLDLLDTPMESATLSEVIHGTRSAAHSMTGVVGFTA